MMGDAWRRRRGTETVEFTISFAAFLAMFALLIVVIIVFINAIAAQRALNEYAVAVGSTGTTNFELDSSCRNSFTPISPGVGTEVQCNAYGASNVKIPANTPCRANDPIKVTITYSQKYLPESLAQMVNIRSEVILTRSMIVPSQSSRGSYVCA